MSQPSNTSSSRILASGLVARRQLAECESSLGGSASEDRLIELLVERRLLTKWQAAQIHAGRTTGFFLEHYKLLAPLGAGGMGQVFRAQDTRLGREVAVKVLPRRRASAEMVQRFRREALAALRVQHENIVRTFELGQHDKTHFLVMELVEGPSLHQYIRKKGKLSVRETARIGVEVARAMEHAAERGIIHRDIKPSNILLTKKGQAKLVDLGLARFFGPRGDTPATMTRTGALMGTLDYLAPEQAEDAKQADSRSDLYSLGCTLYHCLAGRAPFADGTDVQKIVAHREQDPEPITDLNPEVPPGLADVIHRRMLAKNPNERFQTPGEAAAALARWSEEGTGELSLLDVLLEEEAEAEATQRPESTEAPRKQKSRRSRPRRSSGTSRPSTLARSAPRRRRPEAVLAPLGVMAIIGLVLAWMFGPWKVQSISLETATPTTATVERFDTSPKASSPEPAGPESNGPLARLSPAPADELTLAGRIPVKPVDADASVRSPIPRERMAGDWIDVIPLIDPARDRFDLGKETGKNDWRVENGELVFHPDGKYGKLLFPLILKGPSLEWEVEFTRTSGELYFTTDVPARSGVVPIAFAQEGWQIGLGAARRNAAPPFELAMRLRLKTGKRMKLRVRVTRSGSEDHIELFVDDEPVGSWRGDREEIAKTTVAGEDYATNERNGLFVHRDTRFVFHRIRLRMLEGKAYPLPGAASEAGNQSIDLLALIDPQQDAITGNWRIEGSALVTPAVARALLQIPYVPPEEYDLEVVAERVRGNNAFHVGLVAGGVRKSQTIVALDAGPNGLTSGLHKADAKPFDRNSTTRHHNQPVLSKGVPHTVFCRVRKTGLQVFCDGETLIDWKGEANDLSTGRFFPVKNENQLFLGDWESVYHITKLELRPIAVEYLDPPPAGARARERVAATEPTSAGWTPLFNGRDLSGWEVVGGANAWKVIDGILTCTGEPGGWLSTDTTYDDFGFSFEYRLAAEGNSGIFLRAPRQGRPAVDWVEVSLLDDGAPRYARVKPEQFSGGLYGLLAPSERTGIAVLWNKMEILAQGPRVEVTVNGARVTNADLDRLAQKNREHPGLNRRRGYLGLQNHGTKVEFRNLRIMVLGD